MRREAYAKHDLVTLVNVVSACGNLELVFNGKLVHGFAVKTLVDDDVRVRNALITMYGRFGDVDHAMLVFDSCHNRNLCSWNCIISAVAQNREAQTALHLFQNLEFEPELLSIFPKQWSKVESFDHIFQEAFVLHLYRLWLVW